MPLDKALRLKNGNLLIPIRLGETGDGEGEVGEGFIEVKPGSKEYEEWLPFAIEEPTT